MRGFFLTSNPELPLPGEFKSSLSEMVNKVEVRSQMETLPLGTHASKRAIAPPGSNVLEIFYCARTIRRGVKSLGIPCRASAEPYWT